MVRMSDILKKVEQRKQEGETSDGQALPQEQPSSLPSASSDTPSTSPPPTSSPVDPVQPTTQNTATPPTQPTAKHGLRISRPVLDRTTGMANEEAIHLYIKFIHFIKDLFIKVRNDTPLCGEDKEIPLFIEKLVDQQLLNNDNIVGLISLPPEKDYIFNHVVNVAIISIEVGIGIGLKKPELIELGTAALLSDIGMVKFADIYNLPRQLSEEEKEEVRKHTSESFEILQTFKNISPRISTIAYQLHERQDGSGYPCGLKGDSIDDFVKIISVSDIYDALSHPRPYRDAIEPYQALNSVIKAKDILGPRGIRAFIERLCCPYPIGCYVKLSSGEKGMVVGRNIGEAFKPIVEIIYNVNKDGSEMTRIIDLKKTPTLYIKDYLSKSEAKELMY